MYKSNVRLFFITFVLILSLILFTNATYSFLSDNGSEEELKVVFTNDTKELKDTKDVKFEVINNDNVAKGKIAPGMTAEAMIQVDITGTSVPVEIELKKDDSMLLDAIHISALIDGEEYSFGDTKVIDLNDESFSEENGLIDITLKAYFEESSLDNQYGIEGNTYTIPLEITVREHV